MDIPGSTALHPATKKPAEWWRDVVVYQIYPRSFKDSDGDGIGDLPGIISELDHVAELGVGAIWLSPFYPSPQADAGYDVADYCDVEPLFGTLADFDTLLAGAHARGLKVIIDLVPNHSSDEHKWFIEALASAPGSAARNRYMFREGKGANGELPPNNWQSSFGGSAWTRVTEADGQPGQWYLHIFDVKQPDWNWENPEVIEEFHRIIRFWLDRGVDGFRVDVASALIKAEGLPDDDPVGNLLPVDPDNGVTGKWSPGPQWDQPGVHEIYRGWNAVAREYAGDRMFVAEAWVEPQDHTAAYLRHDEMQHCFNFPYINSPWNARRLRGVIRSSLLSLDAVGAPTSWVLNNHDTVRHTARYGYRDKWTYNGIGPDDPQPDWELGFRRARAATTFMLALPGAAYVYQGEELGLPESTTMPNDARQDPTWERSGHAHVGRDGCRVPLPWTADAPAYGFNKTGRSWLPFPENWGDFARDTQQNRADSTLNLYKTLLHLRKSLELGLGDLAWEIEPAGDEDTVISYRNGTVFVMLNLGSTSMPLPANAQHGKVLVASDDLADTHNGTRLLPGNTAVWVELA